MNRQLTLLLYRVVCLGWAFFLGLTLAQAQQVVRVEYYVDTDPGFGKGTNVPITPGLDVTQSFTVPINSLSGGFHNLYVRALVRPYQVTEDGKNVTKGGWSLTNVRTFYKEDIATNVGTAANVVKGEYFIDSDPGFGRGTNIPVSPGQDLTNVSLTVPISALSTGFHNLYVRFKDANGRWSLTAVRTFYKEDTVVGTGVLANIVKG